MQTVSKDPNISDDPDFQHPTAVKQTKRITLFRPGATGAAQRQSVLVHPAVPVPPAGPNAEHALAAANAPAEHVLKTYGGKVFQPGDYLYDQVKDGDELLVVPEPVDDSFQEYPKSMFDRNGASLIVKSKEEESAAAAKGFHESYLQALETAKAEADAKAKAEAEAAAKAPKVPPAGTPPTQPPPVAPAV